MANRLEQASSAYLRSAAHQPVDWHEFDEEAFERARREDKPVLLDIGAVWCHWCHVIDRESYENPEIAALINEHFIAIKVDRDQRPDVDHRYQHVVASISGQGGWPLTAFLTWDGRVIYGGTYFPPDAFSRLLLQIKDLYQREKEKLFQAQNPLDDFNPDTSSEEEAPAESQDEEADNFDGKLHENPVEGVVSAAIELFDFADGGFGSQPKFPHFSGVELLIQNAYRTANPDIEELVRITLTRMAEGGVFDQVAGGFHRYSTDAVWHVPHFEKLAYDNAEALRVYSQGYRLTHDARCAQVVLSTIQWVMDELADREQGGFYASQDADISLDDDGDHFTWTIAEVQQVLSPQEADLVVRHYGMSPKGHMRERPGRNVLRVDMPLPEAASQVGLYPAQGEAMLASAKAKLLAHRRTERPVPFVDPTLYVNWNAMMIVGFLEAADLLRLEEARAFACKTLDRLLSDFYRPGERVLHTDEVDGFLDDTAWLALATVRAYESTGTLRYRQAADDLAALLMRDFADTEAGGFYDLPANTELPAIGLLKLRRKPIEDSPSTSANAAALEALLRLSLMDDSLHGDKRDFIERSLALIFEKYGHEGLFVAALARVADLFYEPALKIELVGPIPEQTRQQALGHWAPGKVVTYQPKAEQPEARLCLGERCLPPVTDLETLPDALASLSAIATPVEG
jgi:uncharacterized protein YyaL (SSP411 family)